MTLDRRAKGGLSAAASIERPNVVRWSTHIRAPTSDDTASNTASWVPVIRRPATSSNTASIGARVLGSRGFQIGVRGSDAGCELRDADGRHQHDHPWRREQSPDHDQLDDRSKQRAAHHTRRETHPIGKPVVEHHERKEACPDEPDAPDGEVDDAVDR